MLISKITPTAIDRNRNNLQCLVAAAVIKSFSAKRQATIALLVAATEADKITQKVTTTVLIVLETSNLAWQRREALQEHLWAMDHKLANKALFG